MLVKVDRLKEYGVEDAVTLMKEVASAKFVETAELHANLNLEAKFNDQQIRTTLTLPHGTGNSKRIAVLAADSEEAQAALDAGADKAGSDDLVASITKGELDFDVLITSPKMMPKLAALGKVLGPKGLMPSKKAGTVTTEIDEAIGEFKAGKLEVRTDKQGVIHVPFGKLDFDEKNLNGNLMALIQCIERNRPTGCKGKLWKTTYIASSMGPGIKLDIAAATRTG